MTCQARRRLLGALLWIAAVSVSAGDDDPALPGASIPAFEASRPITWTGGGCGCVVTGEIGTVYGFYPFWAATGTPQVIDFSQITRIGYFALPIDDQGRLPNPMHWVAHGPAFVREARRHGTKVDLVLYRRDWATLVALGDQRLDEIARELPQRIVDLLDARAPTAGSRLRQFLPFIGSTTPRGDGVTIFFDDLPDESSTAASQAAFARFFRRFVLSLADRMRPAARPMTINIVVPDHGIGRGAFGIPALAQLMMQVEETDTAGLRDGNPARVPPPVEARLLVMFSGPTTFGMKILRNQMDLGMRGDERVWLLRRTIAVPSFAQNTEGQIRDKLAYASWNFGGVGLWPLPVTGEAAGESLQGLLRQAGAGRRDLSPAGDAVCRFTCPNRVPLRYLLGGLLVLGVVLPARTAARWHRRRWHLAAAMVPAAIVAIALLKCDPGLEAARQHTVMPLLLGIVASAWWARRAWRARRRHA